LTIHGFNLPTEADAVCIQGEEACNFQRVRLVDQGTACSSSSYSSAWLYNDDAEGRGSPTSASVTSATWVQNSLWTRGVDGASMTVDVCYCVGTACSSAKHFSVVGTITVGAAAYYSPTFGEVAQDDSFSPSITTRDGKSNLIDFRLAPIGYRACLDVNDFDTDSAISFDSVASGSTTVWQFAPAIHSQEYAVCAGHRFDELLPVTEWHPVGTATGAIGLKVDDDAPGGGGGGGVGSRVDDNQAWTVAPAHPTEITVSGANLLPARDRIMFVAEDGVCGVSDPTPLVYPTSQAANGYLTDLWTHVPAQCPREPHGILGDIMDNQVFVPLGLEPAAAAAPAVVDLPRFDYAYDKYTGRWCGTILQNIEIGGATKCKDRCAAGDTANSCYGWKYESEENPLWWEDAICYDSDDPVKELIAKCHTDDDCYGVDVHRPTGRGWFKGIGCTQGNDMLGNYTDYSPFDFYMRPRYRTDTYSYDVNVVYNGQSMTRTVVAGAARRLDYSDASALRFEPMIFHKPGKYKACFCSSSTEAELSDPNTDRSTTPLGACSFLEDFDHEFGLVTASPISCQILDPGV